MGFDLTGSFPIQPSGKRTLREQAHHALDELVDRMIGAGTDGGAAIIHTTFDAGEEVRFKLMFFNYTDEKDCPFCNGTGVDGS